jgi:hypothetical protein
MKHTVMAFLTGKSQTRRPTTVETLTQNQATIKLTLQIPPLRLRTLAPPFPIRNANNLTAFINSNKEAMTTVPPGFPKLASPPAVAHVVWVAIFTLVYSAADEVFGPEGGG